MRRPELWLDPLDPDLHLKEVRDDPDAPWTRRALAGASVGIPAERGYERCAQLLNAIVMICDGVDEGKIRLAEILSAQADDYQRCLWFAVAGREPWSCFFDLHWLVGAMRTRKQWTATAATGGCQMLALQTPYRLDQPDGPRGKFTPDFTFGPPPDGAN